MVLYVLYPVRCNATGGGVVVVSTRYGVEDIGVVAHDVQTTATSLICLHSMCHISRTYVVSTTGPRDVRGTVHLQFMRRPSRKKIPYV